ncbi:MAG: hypothetical protein KDA65_03390 [Planctomycetaceae bacterium]|nr:hypothetical protein [Planctomycetaceae bacterium]
MRLFIMAACLGLLGIASVDECRADWGCGKPAGCCDTPCDCCSKVLVCCKSTEIKKEKKTCYEVECEHICVPQVKFPWKKLLHMGGGDPCCCEESETTCGKIIAVKKLKKESYEVEKCVCKWEIKEIDRIGCCKP